MSIPCFLPKWNCIFVHRILLVMALADASPTGSALLMGNYILLFRKDMPFTTCICFTYVRGCDLVIVTIREWIV